MNIISQEVFVREQEMRVQNPINTSLLVYGIFFPHHPSSSSNTSLKYTITAETLQSTRRSDPSLTDSGTFVKYVSALFESSERLLSDRYESQRMGGD